MRKIVEEIKVLQSKESGCVLNLRGASLVGHQGEGHSYAAQTVCRSRAGSGVILSIGEPRCGVGGNRIRDASGAEGRTRRATGGIQRAAGIDAAGFGYEFDRQREEARQAATDARGPQARVRRTTGRGMAGCMQRRGGPQ